MGVENNECIIATTWSDEFVSPVKEWIKGIDPEFQTLFAFIPSIANTKTTIIMAPDGSKKGWDTAITGEKIRNKFIKFLETFNYDDGSSPFDYVEVGYGEFGQKILCGNCKNCYGDSEYAGG